jgi:hypothetical protein
MTVLWPLLFHDDVRHDDHVQVKLCASRNVEEEKKKPTPPLSGGKRSEIDCRPTMIDLPTFHIDLTGPSSASLTPEIITIK